MSDVKNDSKYASGSSGNCSVIFKPEFPVKSRRFMLFTGTEDLAALNEILNSEAKSSYSAACA